MKTTLATIGVFLMLAVGCKTSAYKVHPGSINTTDSIAYDTLLSSQAAIDSARPQVVPNGPVPKLTFDQAVAAYNTAEADWQIYHAGGLSDKQLASDLSNLAQALQQLNTYFGGTK